MAEGLDQGTTLFGVHFTTDTDEIDESEIIKYFSRYGEVVFVKQIQYRVYVNFRSRADAEKCLQDTSNKYGEIKRGRFGPRESQSFTKGSNNNYNGRGGSNMFAKTDKFEKRQKYSHASTQSVGSTFEEEDKASYTEDMETYSGKTSPRGAGVWPDKKKAKDNTSPKGPVENRHRSQNCRSSENFSQSHDGLSFSANGPPPLLTDNKQHKSAFTKSLIKGSNGKPALLPTPSIPPLLQLAPTALPKGLHLHQNDLNRPPALLTAHNALQQSTSPSSLHDDSDAPPPLVSVSLYPSQNGSDSKEDVRMSFEDYYKKYGNHVLIANVPEDTTQDEIEKVLYPHVPIHISDLEITGIRMRILFYHVQFSSGEEACRATNQLDGVELRRHRLAMIRLNELLFHNAIF